MGLIVAVYQMIRFTTQTLFIKTLEVFNILRVESEPIFYNILKHPLFDD